MFCDECHLRPVAMKFQVIANGQTIERSLCTICGEKYSGVMSAPMTAPMPFALLSGMLAPMQGAPPAGPLRCAHCGYPFHQFQHTSMLGCAGCYESFAPQMEVILRRSQGGTVQHAGKTPARCGSHFKQRREIEALRAELELAVQDQRFEEAARLRDRIRELEKEVSDDGTRQ